MNKHSSLYVLVPVKGSSPLKIGFVQEGRPFSNRKKMAFNQNVSLIGMSTVPK